MIPTNVMSFMKKMVTTETVPSGSATTTNADTGDGSTTFGKLKQTLSSSLLTAQDKVTKMGPRPSLIPDVDPTPVQEEKPPPQTTASPGQQQQPKPEPGKPPSRTGACRVCLKAFKPDDFSRTCAECTQKVCEDCASYSKLAEDEDPQDWKCSVCRRKLQSRMAVAQDSTESLLDVPVQELQRRHSEARLGGGSSIGSGLGSGLAPPRSPELRRHSDVSPASLKELEKLKGGAKPSDIDWTRSKSGHSTAASRQNSPPREGPPVAPRPRRPSRVTRQHSYGEEIKPTGGTSEEGGLTLPAPMPRRASAYDVFSVPGLSTVTTGPTAAGGRRSSFRVPPPSQAPDNNSPPSPDVTGAAVGSPPTLIAPEDESRRTRRRGSQLPDIAGLRPMPTPRPIPALEDLEATPPRRQASVDAEAIRIVIHDVDSGSSGAAQRRVVLRRDPTDKAHRTRGFGMRVVGGKTGADGRLFAYIVWTVPGGPAEKGGLQPGDKVLEWGGVSLIDRSFEEVCAIMDRTGDVVELLTEHATDLRMCDILDDPIPPASVNMIAGCAAVATAAGGGRKLSDAGIGGLQIDGDNDKTPSSPTRRKLPKTPV